MYWTAATEAVQAVSELLSTSELLFFGGLGGLIGFLVAIAFPYFVGLIDGSVRGTPSVLQVIGVVLIVAFNVGMGCFAAYMVGEATMPQQAILFGIGWPGLLKGAGEGILAISAARDRGAR